MAKVVCLSTLLYPIYEHALTLHLRSQKGGCLSCIGTVRQVCRSDNQSTGTNHVSRGTENLNLVFGVVGDLPVILHVAGEAKHNDPLHFGFEVTVKLLDGIIDDGTTLTADELVLLPISV